VKGFNTLRKSLEKYVEEDFLVGENQYRAEGHGLQDAVKGEEDEERRGWIKEG